MPNHFSSLGIEIKTQDDFIEYFNQTYNRGECIFTDKGNYYRFKMGSGVELWGQLDGSNNAVGMNPAFDGLSRMKVRLERAVSSESDNVLDGAFYGWANPSLNIDLASEEEGAEQSGEGGDYPFIFDLPNFVAVDDIVLPQIVEVQVTAIAHEISIYASVSEYEASQTGEVKFAAESFIPSGLFGNGENQPGEATAMFTGTVVETKILKNHETGNDFAWAKVKTLGGEYDVIADLELVTKEIAEGNILTGSFWLSGRITSDFVKHEKKESRFSFKKLLGFK